MSLNIFAYKTKTVSADVNANFTKILAMFTTGEDFTPLTDGNILTFVTAHRFKPSSLKIYKSGARLRKGITADYVENYNTDGDGVSFTLSVAPALNAPLLADYQKANIEL